MKHTTKFLIFNLAFLALLVIVLAPVVTLAQADNVVQEVEEGKGLVPCGKVDANGKISNPCGFEDFMKLIDRIINFILFGLALPISAVMFAYAGVLMVTSGGSTESRSKAKNIFSSAVIGLILAAGAWLIVNTLLSILGYKHLGLFF